MDEFRKQERILKENENKNNIHTQNEKVTDGISWKYNKERRLEELDTHIAYRGQERLGKAVGQLSDELSEWMAERERY